MSAIGTISEAVVYATFGGTVTICVQTQKREALRGNTSGLPLFFPISKWFGASSVPNIKQSMAAFLIDILDKEGLSYSASNVKGPVYENATVQFSVFDFGDGEGHLYCPMDVNSGGHPNGSSSTTPL
ncbi:hypothetical protein VTN00DRAFT_7559 [Thermoascus crustaceus]|uniref:uncharacterized protein n=1 Tax=Thermoascus crustaceus TaxID=5088 RepID=UPI0037435859